MFEKHEQRKNRNSTDGYHSHRPFFLHAPDLFSRSQENQRSAQPDIPFRQNADLPQQKQYDSQGKYQVHQISSYIFHRKQLNRPYMFCSLIYVHAIIFSKTNQCNKEFYINKIVSLILCSLFSPESVQKRGAEFPLLSSFCFIRGSTVRLDGYP